MFAFAMLRDLGRLRDLSKYYEVLNDFGGYFF